MALPRILNEGDPPFMDVKQTPAKPRARRAVDEAKFLKGWFRQPLMMGAVFPSSRALGEAMARHVPQDALEEGAVVLELGPGTGVVTRSLMARGVPEENLLLVEYSAEFCVLLRSRLPRAGVLQGDAYAPGAALERAIRGRRIAAVVSSLPLMTRPDAGREAAVSAYLRLMEPDRPFIQFTYAPGLPVRPERIGAQVECAPWVKLNLPPARVLVYRRG